MTAQSQGSDIRCKDLSSGGTNNSYRSIGTDATTKMLGQIQASTQSPAPAMTII